MRELLTEKWEIPSYITVCGDMYWYNKKGQYHRDEDKPAIICLNGSKFWYKDGQRHREGNKPAVILNTKKWIKIQKCFGGHSTSYHSHKMWYLKGVLIKTEYNYGSKFKSLIINKYIQFVSNHGSKFINFVISSQ